MDSTKVSGFISGLWDDQIVPQLVEYIKIPNKSPMFDAHWAEHGYMDQAVAQLAGWAKSHPIPGMTVDVVRLQGRTPVIFIDIPATGQAGNSGDDCVLLYGHLDKQPEMTGVRPCRRTTSSVMPGIGCVFAQPANCATA